MTHADDVEYARQKAERAAVAEDARRVSLSTIALYTAQLQDLQRLRPAWFKAIESADKATAKGDPVPDWAQADPVFEPFMRLRRAAALPESFEEKLTRYERQTQYRLFTFPGQLLGVVGLPTMASRLKGMANAHPSQRVQAFDLVASAMKVALDGLGSNLLKGPPPADLGEQITKIMGAAFTGATALVATLPEPNIAQHGYPPELLGWVDAIVINSLTHRGLLGLVDLPDKKRKNVKDCVEAMNGYLNPIVQQAFIHTIEFAASQYPNA